MIFYQKGNESITIHDEIIEFKDGKLSVTDEKTIEKLIAEGYEYEEEETEYTVKELRKIAREKGIANWGKMKKDELLDALKEEDSA